MWPRIRSAGLDSGRILRFLGDPEPESKVRVKTDSDPELLFIFGMVWSLRSLYTRHRSITTIA